MATFVLICLVLVIGALFISSVTHSLSDLYTDLNDHTSETLQKVAPDKDKVISLDNQRKIKAKEGEANIATQDAA